MKKEDTIKETKKNVPTFGQSLVKCCRELSKTVVLCTAIYVFSTLSSNLIEYKRESNKGRLEIEMVLTKYALEVDKIVSEKAKSIEDLENIRINFCKNFPRLADFFNMNKESDVKEV